MGLLRRGGPYPSTDQAIGQVPGLQPDTNLSIVFLALFTAAGLGHFAVLLRNKKRGKKFLINGVVFGFCKVRIITFALRDAWASYPQNVGLGLASTTFVYAGIFLLLVSNLIFSQRILRAQHPKFGWSKPISILFPAVGGLTVFSIILVIVSVLQSVFTLDPHTRSIDKALQLYGLTFLTVVSFLPLPIVAGSCIAGLHPKVRSMRVENPVDKFGEGRMRYNVAIVLVSAFVLMIGTIYRAAVDYQPPTPVVLPDTNPPVPAPQPWYLTKASFYCFNFVTELVVIVSWLGLRIDKRFHVPNKARGSYQEPVTEEKENTAESTQNDADDKKKAKSSRPSSYARSKRLSAVTQVEEGADQVMVLDAFFGQNDGSVAGAAAHDVEDILQNTIKQWELDREKLAREGSDVDSSVIDAAHEEPVSYNEQTDDPPRQSAEEPVIAFPPSIAGSSKAPSSIHSEHTFDFHPSHATLDSSMTSRSLRSSVQSARAGSFSQRDLRSPTFGSLRRPTSPQSLHLHIDAHEYADPERAGEAL